ncbi:MAG TPA: hypothetical protein ENN69_01810 [Spirochaetia bacterium]|nr:hypothetical protein [Spirochaetia bacterium]
MKRVILLLLALTAWLVPLGADLTEWIESTDRDQNGEIIRLLTDADLETSATVARALGTRRDIDLSTIIEHLHRVRIHGDRANAELILLLLLDSFFSDNLTQDQKTARFNQNREALTACLADISGLERDDLRARLIHLIPFTDGTGFHSLLAEEGTRLVEIMRTRDGALTLAETREILAILDVIEARSLGDLTGLCAKIILYTNDPEVVRRARTVALGL